MILIPYWKGSNYWEVKGSKKEIRPVMYTYQFLTKNIVITHSKNGPITVLKQ